MAIAIDSVSDTSTRENSTILHRLHAMHILHIIFYSVVINLLKIIFPIKFSNHYFPRNWITRTLTSGSSCWWWWPRRRRRRRGSAAAPPSPSRSRTSTTTTPSSPWSPTPPPCPSPRSPVSGSWLRNISDHFSPCRYNCVPPAPALTASPSRLLEL